MTNLDVALLAFGLVVIMPRILYPLHILGSVLKMRLFPRDLVIRHYQEGKLIRQTTIFADIRKPLKIVDFGD